MKLQQFYYVEEFSNGKWRAVNIAEPTEIADATLKRLRDEMPGKRLRLTEDKSKRKLVASAPVLKPTGVIIGQTVKIAAMQRRIFADCCGKRAA